MSATVSFIVATIGRPSLARTLQSIETRPGDEIIVVADAALRLLAHPFIREHEEVRLIHCPPGNDWGHSERNFSTPFAKGDFLSFMDDDDYYAVGHRDAMEQAALTHPNVPTIFSMRLHHMGGLVLWQDKEVRCGQVGTPMYFIPNVPSKIGVWPPYYGGDCTFMQSCKWEAEEINWSKVVVAEVTGNSL